MADSKNRPKLIEGCDGCGACIDVCKQKCISKQGRGKPVAINLENCSGCGKCAEICFLKPSAIIMLNPLDFDTMVAIEEESAMSAEQEKRMGTGLRQTAGVE